MSVEPESAQEIAQDDEWEDAEQDRWLASSDPNLTDAEIEAIYEKGETRLVTQPMDFLIRELHQSIQKEDFLNLRPEYQRRLVWSAVKRSRLIESLLMNVPIPPVMLYEAEFAKYEVMDGQQRLDTIRAFLGNEFALTGLSEWACLNGKRWQDLPRAIHKGLVRRTITAVVVLHESAKDPQASWALRRSVFERLNTGAEKLNAQEIRNCVYRSRFNELLQELARTDEFTRVWGIPPRESGEPAVVSDKLRKNRLYSRMLDNEIVLRFFALADAKHVRASMRATLDSCMERHMKDAEGQMETLRSDLLLALHTAIGIYENQTFKLLQKPESKRPLISRPLYDAVMVGIHRFVNSCGQSQRPRLVDALLAHRGAIVQRTGDSLSDPQQYEILVGRPNTRTATLGRIDLLQRIFDECAGG